MYKGQSYKVPQVGGWNANPNYDMVANECMVNPKNINHYRGGREPRGGCEAVFSSALASTPVITGGYQFTLESASTFMVLGCSNGYVYRSDVNDFTICDTAICSTLSTNKYYHFETFYNKLYICNGANIPQTWDGASTSTSNMANIPTSWTGVNYPKALITHGIRAQKRLWAYGVPSMPNYLFASASGSDNMSDANVTTIKLLCQEITGLIEFGGRLLAFSKDKTFIIDDVSLDTSEWGYQAAAWEGGCAHQRLIIKTPTDVMVMSETVEMFSISASQQYGDYQVASLTRPAYLHKWVETALDLTKIAQFHGCYDPELRAIKMFMVGTGKTYPDIAMVFFIDMGAQQGWTKHEFMCNLCSSWVMRVSASDWKIYAGGSAGKAFSLESSTLEDDGTVYRTEWSTPPMTFDNPRSKKRYDRMWLVAKPVALETISVDTIIDDRNLSGEYTVTDEYGNVLGDESNNTLASESYNPWELTMTGYSNILQNFGDDIGFAGMRIQSLVYNTLGENFFISSLIYDLEELGAA